jgi:hypothetical protein
MKKKRSLNINPDAIGEFKNEYLCFSIGGGCEPWYFTCPKLWVAYTTGVNLINIVLL